MSGNDESNARPRMRTREKNAGIHPGEKYKEASRSRQPSRPHEVIQKEKEEKMAIQQARAQAKALKAAGEERATQLEKEKRAMAASEDEHIPRRLPANKRVKQPQSADANTDNATELTKKRKVNDNIQSDEDTTRTRKGNATKKTRMSHKARQASPAPQAKRPYSSTVSEASDENERAQKRVKLVAKPLRRHETVVEELNGIPTSSGNQAQSTIDTDVEVPEDDSDQEQTPKQKKYRWKEDARSLADFTPNDVSEPELPFKSPHTLLNASQSRQMTKKTYAEVVSGESGSEDETELGMRKKAVQQESQGRHEGGFVEKAEIPGNSKLKRHDLVVERPGPSPLRAATKKSHKSRRHDGNKVLTSYDTRNSQVANADALEANDKQQTSSLQATTATRSHTADDHKTIPPYKVSSNLRSKTGVANAAKKREAEDLGRQVDSTRSHSESGADFTTVESDVAYIHEKSQESMTRRKTSHPGQVASKKTTTNGAKKRGAVREQDNEIVQELEPESDRDQSRAGTAAKSDAAHLHKSLKSIAPRKTSSNPVVGGKKGSSEKRAVVMVKGVAEEVANGSEPGDVRLRANGGLSDDDTLEQEAAMSSPLKGTDSRGSAKAMIKGKKGKGKAKRKTARIEDLPADARSIWQSTVIPNLLFLLLSEEQPWEVSDDNLKKALTKVCDCAYGDRIKMDVEKGETAFELATQVLYNYRSKYATNAIHVVLTNLCKWLSIDLLKVNNEWDQLSDLAEKLLHKRRFIFKGGEPPGEFRPNGRFANILIIETFQSHFSAYTQGRAILKTGPSFCGLALATAAAERALTLVHKKLLTVTFESRAFKFIVKKTLNPNTGKSSAIDSEFSAQNWNARTLRHLKDIHVLGEARFNQIFDMASNSRRRGRAAANPEPSNNSNDYHSDDTLQSEDDGEGDGEAAHDANIIMQDYKDNHSTRYSHANDGNDDHGDRNKELYSDKNRLKGDEMKDVRGDEDAGKNAEDEYESTYYGD